MRANAVPFCLPWSKAGASAMFTMAERLVMFFTCVFSFALLGRREDHADGSRDLELVAGRRQPAALLVNPEQNGIVGILIGRQQKRSRRIDSKSARHFPLRGCLLDGRERSFL